MRILKICFAVTAVTSFGPSLQAAPIVGLYYTGVDGAHNATTGNATDLHWTLGGAPARNGGSNGQFPIGPWLTEDAVSRWATPAANAGGSFDAAADGLYTYSLRFSLAGFDPASASFEGRFSVDNAVDGIFLNGTQISGSGGWYTGWTGFASTGAGFNADLNILGFTVRNFAQGSGNPTGLRVEFLTSQISAGGAVPEPESWTLMIAGFGLVGAALRRRQSRMPA